MDLAVAVRAEHHALRELGNDLFPTTWDPILRDPKLLLVGTPMMKLEDRGYTRALAGEAHAAHVGNRPDLPSTAMPHHGTGLDVLVLDRVTGPMADRAQEVALLDFAHETHLRSMEAADREVFRGRITMVEVQSRDAR